MEYRPDTNNGQTPIPKWDIGLTPTTSVTIPNGVTSIGSYTFYDCSSLATVNYRGTKAQWSKISISSGNDCIKKAAKNYNYTGK